MWLYSENVVRDQIAISGKNPVVEQSGRGRGYDSI